MTTTTIYPSAARTVAPGVVDFTTGAPGASGEGPRSVIVVIDVSAIVASPSITLTVFRRDAAAANMVQHAVSAPITAVGQHVITIGDGAALDSSYAAAPGPVPPYLRFSVAHGDADSITYSVTAHTRR